MTERHMPRVVKAIFRVTALIAACSAAVGAMAADPGDPYAKEKATSYSKENLDSAIATIAQMGEKELRAFTDYLAECGDDGGTEVAKHACNVAMDKYEIEFGTVESKHGRSLDGIIYARNLLFIGLPEEKAHLIVIGALPCFHTSNAKELEECTIRTTAVISALEEAAHDRFSALKSTRR
jgi:hypothetical protein